MRQMSVSLTASISVVVHVLDRAVKTKGTRRMMCCLITFCAAFSAVGAEKPPDHVVWQGAQGLPGSGKHIVYIANDHEYRSEESLAALARIMAKHYGFKC